MAETLASLRRQAHRGHDDKLRRYAGGGHVDSDEAQDKRLVKRAISEHEAHDHPGEPKTKLKLRHGGVVEGETAKPRLDRAHGGRTGKSKKHSKTNVNVIVAPQGGGAHPVPVPVPVHGAPAVPPHPPMAPPVAGMGAPPGLPPRPPVAAGVPGMMPRKNGGRTYATGGAYARGGKVKEEGGAGSGLGRLEKIKDYGKDADVKEPGVKGTGREKMKRGGRA